MSKEISRADNLKRAKGEKGLAGDTDTSLFKQHKHSFGYNGVSMQGLDLGTPWKASEDPEHNCQDNGCRLGSHYMKPKWPGRASW